MTKKMGISTAAEALKKLQDKANGRNTQEVFPASKPIEKKKAAVLDKSSFWKLFKKYAGAGYILDNRNQDVIFTVFRYFLQDPDFNQAGIIKSEPDLNKGLLIFGDYGIGKSYLFDILHKMGKELISQGNSLMWFRMVSAGELVERYMSESTNKESTFRIENFHKGKLYIDDLGFEEKAFGRTELLGEVLFERHRKNSRTFLTTNLNPTQIGQRYGARIEDRLPEMFNIIKWEGQSFRK